MPAPHRPLLNLDTAVAPPRWALLERHLLATQAQACRDFYDKYFDASNGHLLCVPRWGGDDGPDDAAENQLNWTILHALGAPDDILPPTPLVRTSRSKRGLRLIESR